MLSSPAFVHDVLTDVMTRGVAVVDKKKLLFALGAKQDRPSAWSRLLDAWEELDGSRNALRGHEVWNTTIVLAFENDPDATLNLEQVSGWGDC